MKLIVNVKTKPFFVISFIVCCVPAWAEDQPTLAIRETIPNIECYSIEGLPVSLHAPEQKKQLLIFFDSRGSDVLSVLAEYKIVCLRFHDYGLNCLAIATDEHEDTVIDLSERLNLPWPTVLDRLEDDSRITETLGVPAIPYTILVDANGKILAHRMMRELIHETLAILLNIPLDEAPMPVLVPPKPVQPETQRGPVFFPTTFKEPYLARLGTEQERDHAEHCKRNFRIISLALTRYRDEHDGRLPHWLSELYPDYLHDENVLLCPHNPNPPLSPLKDPHKPCSYVYEFADAKPVEASVREWRTEQLQEYGDRVPVIRCFNHPRSINLTYGGEIVFYDFLWESQLDNGKTLDGLEASIRCRLRRIASAFSRFLEERSMPPGELSELTPRYLGDTSNLIDPNTQREFEYTLSAGSGRRDEWMSSLDAYGDYLPIVRVHDIYENKIVINLGYGGEIWESGEDWKSDIGKVKLLPTPPKPTPTATPRPRPAYLPIKELDDPIEDSLVIKGLKISQVLRMLYNESGIVFDVKHEGNSTIDLSLSNCTYRDVLDSVLPLLGLRYRRQPDGSVVIDLRENIESKQTND